MNNPTSDAQRQLFVVLLNRIADDAWKMAEDKGFHAAQHDCEYPELATLAKLGLITSEVGEAVEAVRDGGLQSKSDKIPPHSHFAEELSDIVIRVMDLAGSWDINLGAAILDKMAVNAGRPQMHGKSL